MKLKKKEPKTNRPNDKRLYLIQLSFIDEHYGKRKHYMIQILTYHMSVKTNEHNIISRSVIYKYQFEIKLKPFSLRYFDSLALGKEFFFFLL